MIPLAELPQTPAFAYPPIKIERSKKPGFEHLSTWRFRVLVPRVSRGAYHGSDYYVSEWTEDLTEATEHVRRLLRPNQAYVRTWECVE